MLDQPKKEKDEEKEFVEEEEPEYDSAPTPSQYFSNDLQLSIF